MSDRFTTRTYDACNTATGKRGQYWYDRRTRSWVGYEIDADGCQVGSATYVYTKREVQQAMLQILGVDVEAAIVILKKEK